MNRIDKQAKGTILFIDKADSNSFDSFQIHTSLFLDDAPVSQNEILQGDQDIFPLAGGFEEQSVLIDVGGDGAFSLDVDKVFAAVAFDAEKEVGAAGPNPHGLGAKERRDGRRNVGRPLVVGAEHGVTALHNIWSIGGQVEVQDAMEMAYGKFRGKI